MLLLFLLLPLHLILLLRIFIQNHRTATHRGPIHDFWRFVTQRLMWALAVVKDEVFCQADHQFAHRGVTVQIHVLVLDVAP